MPEINEQKENYMSIDDFLTKYYASFKDKGPAFNRNIWAITSMSPKSFDEWYKENKDYITPREIQELYAEIAKAMGAGTFEAQRFLNMVKTLTIFDDSGWGELKPTFYDITKAAQMASDMISIGYITNPSNSYELLEHIMNKCEAEPNLKNDAALWLDKIAEHPMAEPRYIDKYLEQYVHSSYGGAEPTEKGKKLSREFIHKMVPIFDSLCTRISKKIDKIKAERPFDFRERLQKLQITYIPSIVKQLLALISYQNQHGIADKQEFAPAINLLKNAIAEFNIENIMAFMTRDSQQEFEESDRMKLAKLEEEYKKLQEESKNELNAAKQREQKLTKDLQNEKSKVDLYQGRASLSEGHADNVEKELESLKQLMDQINIDIEQSRGLPIRRWRALKEMFQKLFDKFGKSEQKIKIDKKIYKQGYDQLMSNFHNNGGHLDI